MTYRVAVQRGRTGAGELVVAIADGSDPRQQWAQQLLLRVLLPNLVLVAAAALAIHWAVGRAFKPLVDLAEAVEHRSPRDLSPIDEAPRPPRCVRWCIRSTACLPWSTRRRRGSAGLWPTQPTSCERRWQACRHRWKPGPMMAKAAGAVQG